MKRGQLWQYEPVLARAGQSTLRLIVSADGINDAGGVLPTVWGLHVLDSDPGQLLAVGVPPWGWASALTLERVMRRRLSTVVGEVSPDAMKQVDSGLRALLDL